MKKILSVFATFALMASQAPFAQAMPIETSTRLPEKQPAPVFMPDAVGLLNLLTMGAESGELGLDAAFEPVQDDTTPPVITFVPATLTLFPPFGSFTLGNIVSVSFDAEAPFIVAAGAAAGDVNIFNVDLVDLVTFFELVEIPLPGGTGEVALGIGFFAAAQFIGFHDLSIPLCPCGAIAIAAVDIAGNVSNRVAPVVVVSF
jgi:hypothetical protein